MEIEEIEKRLKEFEKKLKPITADKLKALREKTEQAKHYAEMNASEVMELTEKKDIEKLIAVIEYGKNKNAVKHAIIALGELKDNRAVEPLIYALKSNLGTIRQWAVIALGDIGDGRAVKPLILVMKDKDELGHVREFAVEALGKIATEEGIVSLIGVLDTGWDEKVSLVLKKVGNPAVIPLVTALNGGNETIMWKAATILGEIGDKRAVEPLIALLLDESKDGYYRGEYVATALGKIGDVKAVEPLIKLASRHAEDQLSCRSVGALGDIGNRRSVIPLIAILEDGRTMDNLHVHLRLETCWALHKLKDTRAIKPLIKIVEDLRENKLIREAAASALVGLDDDRIELPLLKFFKAELEARVKCQDPEHQEDEVLEALLKLITRMIDKSRGV